MKIRRPTVSHELDNLRYTKKKDMRMVEKRSQVYFIGAGPGDPELITVKGQKCIERADLVLYAGSLVPKELVACAQKEAKVVDSSSMTLKETHAMMIETIRSGEIVASVHPCMVKKIIK